MALHQHVNRWARRSTLIAALSMVACAAWAQPGGAPIKLYVGYSAGGPVDQAARIFAPALAKELGVNVIVENKTGANATLAGDAVARAKPDGSALWFAASPTITISPNVMKKMQFDPAIDFTPLAPVLGYYNVLVINKDLPFQTVPELVAYAKAHPDKLSYGSAGVGSSNHLSAKLFADRTGIRLNHIPYKGNSPAMTDVMGGQLTMMFDIVATAKPFISSNKVRAVALTSPQHNPSLPGVPTMSESNLPGLAGFDVGGWYGVYGPKGMTAESVARFNKAINAALAQPEFKSRLDELGYEPWTGSPKVLADRGAKERALWATVTNGIEIE